MLACILLYYTGWILNYCGMATTPVILLMTVPPCAAFILFYSHQDSRSAI